jgi:hypothetical protein
MINNKSEIYVNFISIVILTIFYDDIYCFKNKTNNKNKKTKTKKIKTKTKKTKNDNRNF